MSGLKILIVGGYGAFGGRLVELLRDDPGLTLIVAGRDRGRAVHFCGRHLNTKAILKPARFDRERDLTAQLPLLKPDLVVDASGPFQSYGKQRYKLIEACIAQGIDYIDLADGSGFVEGVGRFDEAARDANVYILSGASTCPVLTAAVVRRLAQGGKVNAIRAGIAPSPFAKVGESVVRAIASYAGKKVTLRREGRDVTAHPFTQQLRYTIEPPRETPLEPRSFSLVDVPDLATLPRLWPEAKTVWVGAAPMPAALHRMLIMAAWLVRAHLLPSLTPFATLMNAAVNRLQWGEHRGGMFVEIETEANGRAVKKSWHLVAEGDDGPLIPLMAAAALIRKHAAGQTPPAGARAAVEDLELSDYEALFATRDIHTGVREEAMEAGPATERPFVPAPEAPKPVQAPVVARAEPVAARTEPAPPPSVRVPPRVEAVPAAAPSLPLYRRLLGAAYDQLPRAVRVMHDGVQRAQGRAKVERGGNPLSQIAGWMMEFPRAGADMPVEVRFTAADGIETWRRTFAGQSFSSKQYVARQVEGDDPRLCERFGAFAFVIALSRDGDRLCLTPRTWTAFGVPLPLWLGPRFEAYETEENGAFRFFVEISHPLCGLIVRYRGLLRPMEVARAEAA